MPSPQPNNQQKCECKLHCTIPGCEKTHTWMHTIISCQDSQEKEDYKYYLEKAVSGLQEFGENLEEYKKGVENVLNIFESTQPDEETVEEPRFRCEGCYTVYAEYVNGCVKCWDDTLSREENLKKFPNRSVRPFILPNSEKPKESDEEVLENWPKLLGVIEKEIRYNTIMADRAKYATEMMIFKEKIAVCKKEEFELIKNIIRAVEQKTKRQERERAVKIMESLKHIEPLGPIHAMDGLISWNTKNNEIDQAQQKILNDQSL